MPVGSNLNLKVDKHKEFDITRSGELDFQVVLDGDDPYAVGSGFLTYVQALQLFQWLKKELGQ